MCDSEGLTLVCGARGGRGSVDVFRLRGGVWGFGASEKNGGRAGARDGPAFGPRRLALLAAIGLS